jgi:3-deoxy-7-phosphoheptulonate synthase
MSLAGLAAGADGLIIEVHPNPDSAACDASQTITPETLARIVRKGKAMVELLADEPVHAGFTVLSAD